MNNITATGNNFGAGDIQFQCFEQENLLILNAEVEFDPSNAAYQAVSQLEIYVPDLAMGKSAITGMLMFGTLNGKKTGTTIKAYIHDKNTIVVEKVNVWDNNDTITLVFSNSFVPRNVKGEIVKLPRKYVSVTETVGTVSTGQAYWTFTDDWVFFGVTLNRIKQPDFDTEVSFKIKDVPDVEDFDGIMLCYQGISPSVGTDMLRFQIRNNVFSVEKFSSGSYLGEKQYCGFICYVPRKASNE